MQKTIKFTLMGGEKGETLNTIKFKEVPGPGEYRQIGTLYLQRALCEQAGNPRDVTVTLDL
jgi:hypothetical protein